MSFNLKMFDCLYGGALDSHGPLKLIIRSALFQIFSMLFMTWDWICQHSWQPHQRWNSNIAEYIVFKSFESTWYLILAKRPFALLSLSCIVSMCCLNVRCWSSFKPKYLASLRIFIFCPLILKFIYFLISIFFVLKSIIFVWPIFNKILFALIHSIIFLRSKLIFLLMFFRDLLE